MLQTLQFMSIKQQLHHNACLFIFKILRDLLTEQLKNKLKLVGNASERQTRHAGDIAIQFHRTRSAQKSMFYKRVKLYNALAEIKQCKRIEQFKRIYFKGIYFI